MHVLFECVFHVCVCLCLRYRSVWRAYGHLFWGVGLLFDLARGHYGPHCLNHLLFVLQRNPIMYIESLGSSSMMTGRPVWSWECWSWRLRWPRGDCFTPFQLWLIENHHSFRPLGTEHSQSSFTQDRVSYCWPVLRRTKYWWELSRHYEPQIGTLSNHFVLFWKSYLFFSFFLFFLHYLDLPHPGCQCQISVRANRDLFTLKGQDGFHEHWLIVARATSLHGCWEMDVDDTFSDMAVAHVMYEIG